MRTKKITVENVENAIQNGYKIDIGENITKSFNLLKENLSILSLSMLLLLIVGVFLSFTVIGWFLYFALIMGYSHLVYRVKNGKLAKHKDIFYFFKSQHIGGFFLYMTLIFASFLIPIGLIVFLIAMNQENGFDVVLSLVLVLSYFMVLIGSFLFYVGLFFAPYLIAFGDYSVITAIKKSVQLAKKNFWMLFLFMLLASLIGSIGSIACYVGVIVTMPMTYIMHSLLVEDVLIKDEKSEIDEIGFHTNYQS